MKVPHRDPKKKMSGHLLLLLLMCNVFGAPNADETPEDNELWSGLLKGCKKPSATCVKTTIHDYLKDTLDHSSDVRFASFLGFTRNTNNYTAAPEAAEDDERALAEETPLEEVTRSLRDNSRRFLMTHDLELQLPETFFMGTVLKVSPRSLDDSSGTLVKVDLEKRDADGSSRSLGEGRIFIKKIQEYIGERLLLAFLAILVVIKLLAVKVLFVLPAIIGVAAAKKLILKIVLFLFPALHHLFKLCAYTPYGAKHHIHKHQIAHIHQVAHPHKNHPYKHHYEEGPPGYHYGDGPPGHHHDESYAHDEYGEPDHHPSGPYFGNEIISHRRDPEEDNEVDGWGQGQQTRRRKPDTNKPLTPTEIENIVLKAEKEALIKSRLQREKQRIHEENLRLQQQLNNALKIQEKLKQQAAFHSAKVTSATKTRYPSAPLVPPPRPPPNKYPQEAFAEPPYRPSTFVDPLQSAVRTGNSIGSSNDFGLQNAAGSSQPTVGMGQAVRVGNSFGMPNGAVGNVVGSQQQSTGGLNLVGFKNVLGLGNTAGHGHHIEEGSTADFGLQGIIGAGLPGETVQAVQNFVKQKTSQTQQQVYPVYNQNQAFHQDNIRKQPPVDIVKSVEITEPFEKPKGPALAPSFESFSGFDESKPPKQNQAGSITNQFEDDIYKAASVTFDPFYSPILEKIDDVLNNLDFVEEPCRERLICSMYKNPARFSPHSNLLSSDLSRDSTELKKPSSTNAAVVRFYKYVQAARDGQDKRDCIRLYPACAVNTEAEE